MTSKTRTDPSTLATQVSKLKERFGLSRVVLAGDRGMITAARIKEDLAPAGLDWLTALRAPAIQALASAYQADGPPATTSRPRISLATSHMTVGE